MKGIIVAAGNWWLVVEAIILKEVCIIMIIKSLQGCYEPSPAST